GQAKKAGRHLMLRTNWEDVKIDIMANLVRQKFQRHEYLKQNLLETGNAKLIEGNGWGDIFWGMYKGVGKNMLGKILMQVREEIQINDIYEMHTDWCVNCGAEHGYMCGPCEKCYGTTFTKKKELIET
ncbi:NADAR family protein, partial [Candidatus Pacearchaeota archaeon]|nr:NADAR family protein [Candidatus Pacearchaeota archaeon]